MKSIFLSSLYYTETQSKNLHNIGDNTIIRGAKNSHSLLQKIICFLQRKKKKVKYSMSKIS